MQHESTLGELEDRLLAAGWSDSRDRVAVEDLRVASQRLFRVVDAFPRLTTKTFAGGVPAGITDVGYTLDTTALDSWLVATTPRPYGVLQQLGE